MHLLTINTLFIYVFGHFTYKFFVFIHVSFIVRVTLLFFIHNLIILFLLFHLFFRQFLISPQDEVPLFLEVLIKLGRVLVHFSLESVQVYIHVPILLDCHMFVQLLLSLFYYFIYFLHGRSFSYGAEELILHLLLGPQGVFVLGVSQILLLLMQHQELFLLPSFVLGHFKCLTFGVVVPHVEGVQFVHRG